jgi:hypothetical protein
MKITYRKNKKEEGNFFTRIDIALAMFGVDTNKIFWITIGFLLSCVVFLTAIALYL